MTQYYIIELQQYNDGSFGDIKGGLNHGYYYNYCSRGTDRSTY